MNTKIAYTGRATLLTTVVLGLSGVISTQAYVLRIQNGYHSQVTTFFCGPASIQMMLDSPQALPNLHPQSGNQFAIFDVVRANNIAPRWFADPVGLRAGVDFFDLNPAHTYVVRDRANANQANRDIANSIVDSRIPASSLVLRGAHWIDVYGVHSSAMPVVNQPYTIHGFFARDPWPLYSPIGHARYLANNERGWLHYFRGVNPTSPGPWDNKFVAVTDAPPDDDGFFNSFPAPPSQGPMLTAEQAAARALLELDEISELGDEFGFSVMDGSFSSANAQFIQWFNDKANQGEWLLPFIDPNAAAGDNITAAVLLDAFTGEISQATWILEGQDPVTFEQLSSVYEAEYAGKFVRNSGAFMVPDSELPRAMVAAVLLLPIMLRRRRDKPRDAFLL